MAIRLGNAPVIDLYYGSNPIDRVYLGQSKIYDAFSEISGNLPLTFNARRAENLNDYTIYGTASGSGVKTNNLFSAKLEQGTLDPTGGVMDSDFRIRTSDFITLTNSPYFVLSGVGIRVQAMIYVYDNNGTYLRTLIGEWAAVPLTFSVSTNEKIKIIFRKYDNTIITPDYLTTNMITEGTTVPTTYTPPGYKLPLKVESGAQSQDITIYIGDSKLGEEEYVNFKEQKIYRLSPDLWNVNGQTTNYYNSPPVPLPPISLYKGENILSSTETLGNVTLKGRIN